MTRPGTDAPAATPMTPSSSRPAPLLFGLLVLLLAAACGPEDGGTHRTDASTGEADAVLFEGARLILGDGSRIENGAFLVNGDRFAAVGSAGELPAPPGAGRVDLSGKTVIPAMIDAHAHLGFEGYGSWGAENYTRENVVDHLKRYAYYGFGAVYSTGTDPADLLQELQGAQREGEVGGARVLFAAGVAPPDQGPNPTMLAEISDLSEGTGRPIVRGVATPEDARRTVRDIADAGISFIKIWVDDRGGTQEKLSSDVYGPLVDEARRHGIPVHAHQQSVEDMRDLVRAGVAGFLHGRFGPEMDEPFASLLAERGVFVVPNQGLLERDAWRVFDDPFFAEAVRPEVVERLREEHEGGQPSAAADRSRVRAALRRLAAAGVDFLLGTDAGAVPNHFFGYSGHRELEIYTRMGLTPMEALVAATSRPAEHLGLADRGVIESGRSADFVVLDANPLDDIRNTRRIARVYLRGEEVDRAGLRDAWTGGR